MSSCSRSLMGRLAFCSAKLRLHASPKSSADDLRGPASCRCCCWPSEAASGSASWASCDGDAGARSYCSRSAYISEKSSSVNSGRFLTASCVGPHWHSALPYHATLHFRIVSSALTSESLTFFEMSCLVWRTASRWAGVWSRVGRPAGKAEMVGGVSGASERRGALLRLYCGASVLSNTPRGC